MDEPLVLTDFELICKALCSKSPRYAIWLNVGLVPRLKEVEDRALSGTRFTFLLSDVRPGCAGAVIPDSEWYLQVFTIETHTGKQLATNTLYTFDLPQGVANDFSHAIQKLN